jgi:hypothetical protein
MQPTTVAAASDASRPQDDLAAANGCGTAANGLVAAAASEEVLPQEAVQVVWQAQEVHLPGAVSLFTPRFPLFDSACALPPFPADVM